MYRRKWIFVRIKHRKTSIVKIPTLRAENEKRKFLIFHAWKGKIAPLCGIKFYTPMNLPPRLGKISQGIGWEGCFSINLSNIKNLYQNSSESFSWISSGLELHLLPTHTATARKTFFTFKSQRTNIIKSLIAWKVNKDEHTYLIISRDRKEE